MITPKFVTEKADISAGYGKFVISPLPEGYGQTVGNSLRRVLLSSIEGVGITYIKIDGVNHPFSTLEGVKESVLEIMLNLKLLRFTVAGDGPFTVSYSGKGVGKVTGADFKGGDVTVVNDSQYIAEVTSAKTKLNIELTLEKGMGYSIAEDKEKRELGVMATDSIFSPVSKVNYKVDGVRVGRTSKFEKVTLEIWTDGTIKPIDALEQASTTLQGFFGHVLSDAQDAQTQSDNDAARVVPAKEVDKKVYQTIIDELDLPTRVINALLREKIETVEDLLARGKEDLVGLKGVGRKSVDLIEKELEKLGIPFV